MKHVLVAAIAFASLTGVAFAQDGDPAKGEKIFARCRACHAIGPDAANKVGPELNGVVGRKWASVEGFNYSDGLKKGGEEGKVWDEATLDAWLTNPRKLVSNTKMVFPGLPKEQDRKDVIAYLKQFDASGQEQ